ncbi:MAG: hypothetical protein KJS91_16870 [Planctomycetes bacterium]|nr:hypothetical protein [Planctomycetota bacterium]
MKATWPFLSVVNFSLLLLRFPLKLAFSGGVPTGCAHAIRQPKPRIHMEQISSMFLNPRP